MALRTYVKEAWEDIADLQNPNVNGARETADVARIYQNNAWEDVWTSIRWMSQLESTFSVAEAGYSQSSSHDYTIWNVTSDYNDGGYATYYLEGDFSNPAVSFDWYGFFYYAVSDGSVHYAPAGSISLYTRTTGGTESYPSAVSNVGSDTDSDEGSFSTTLNGNFDRIGFRIKLRDWGAADPFYYISVWNFLIDGDECLPSEDCCFN